MALKAELTNARGDINANLKIISNILENIRRSNPEFIDALLLYGDVQRSKHEYQASVYLLNSPTPNSAISEAGQAVSAGNFIPDLLRACKITP